MLIANPNSLKITLEKGPQALTMRLEGKLAGDVVGELLHAWQSLTPALNRKHLVIDLRNVMSIDETGVALLAKIHDRTGAQFRADTPLTKYFAERAMKNAVAKEERKGD